MPIAKVHQFKRPSKEESAELLRRAVAAWIATPGAVLPDAGTSGVHVHQGLGYVVLRGAGGVLAVYRIRSDNHMLRRMKRWPGGLARGAS